MMTYTIFYLILSYNLRVNREFVTLIAGDADEVQLCHVAFHGYVRNGIRRAFLSDRFATDPPLPHGDMPYQLTRDQGASRL